MEQYLHIGKAEELSSPRDRYLYRALEIMPAFLAWSTLIAVVVLSFLAPVAMAIFIIAFDIYWLTKTIYLSLHMRAAFTKMREHTGRNWLKELGDARTDVPELSGIRWQDVYHLVILPTAKEPLQIVRQSFASLARTRYPKDKMIVVLAIEERAGQQAVQTARAVEEEFGKTFFKFVVTRHPDNLPGEIPGKGSNETWAGRQVKRDIIDPLRIPYSRILVSVFDIDTVVPEQFFACLTWHFLTAPKPLRSSFQPIPLFTNNIWEAPAFARVFAFSTTFWQMIQQARPERLVTFSSQSLSFSALVDVDFWQTNMVSEDSRIFWQCLLRYNGDWRTVPLYFPVSMDANVAPTFWQTAKNQYKQIRRWLYGVENNAFLLFGFVKNKAMPLAKKLNISWFMVETSHSAATNSLIIFFLGWLPLMVGGNSFSGTVLAYHLPQITRTIMALSMVGLASSAIISILLLPPRPPSYGRFRTIWMVLQWVFFPINFIVFGAIPALDAQTRLALGAYLGFWATPKSRNTYSK